MTADLIAEARALAADLLTIEYATGDAFEPRSRTAAAGVFYAAGQIAEVLHADLGIDRDTAEAVAHDTATEFLSARAA